MAVYFMLEPAHKMVHHAKTADPPQWGSMPRHQMQVRAVQMSRAAFSLSVAA